MMTPRNIHGDITTGGNGDLQRAGPFDIPDLRA
jgi:hypothetical protein